MTRSSPCFPPSVVAVEGLGFVTNKGDHVDIQLIGRAMVYSPALTENVEGIEYKRQITLK